MTQGLFILRRGSCGSQRLSKLPVSIADEGYDQDLTLSLFQVLFLSQTALVTVRNKEARDTLVAPS